jgi:hypothetical protein
MTQKYLPVVQRLKQFFEVAAHSLQQRELRWRPGAIPELGVRGALREQAAGRRRSVPHGSLRTLLILEFLWEMGTVAEDCQLSHLICDHEHCHSSNRLRDPFSEQPYV